MSGDSVAVTPFVLVIDRSASMKGNDAIATINRELPELIAELSEIPEVEETVSIGLISFAETAEVHRRLRPMTEGVEVPSLSADGNTSYEAPLRKLKSMLEKDLPELGSRGRRPIVFFITDGNPNFEDDEIWEGARAELLDEGFRLRPKLVALGCGKVTQSCLRKLASDPSLADWKSGPTREALTAILDTVEGTIITLGSGGQVRLDSGSLAGRIIEFGDYDTGIDEIFEYAP